jgi:hypothetical protein
MDAETLEALRNLIEYMTDAEEQHYEECHDATNHIYEDVMKVKAWLDNG